MKLISNTTFEGERPCFSLQDTQLQNVRIYPGESAIKHSRNIIAEQCEFMGKYPFWHNDYVTINKSWFTTYARAAIWYSRNVHMSESLVDAPKMFRRVDGLWLDKVTLSSAEECCWNCKDIHFNKVNINKGDYLLMNSENIEIDGMVLEGNYSFQDAKNIVIRNSVLNSRDALWGTENCTVYDSILDGEFLGWHSKNLRLVNCTISGTQPLCFAKDLVIENCLMEGADFAFEHSTVDADINSHVISIRNPAAGRIRANSVGDIIVNEHGQPSTHCQIDIKTSQHDQYRTEKAH